MTMILQIRLLIHSWTAVFPNIAEKNEVAIVIQ
jgi:hypothetical protein